MQCLGVLEGLAIKVHVCVCRIVSVTVNVRGV